MASDPITGLPALVVSVCSQVAAASMPWLAAAAAAVLIGLWVIRRVRGLGDESE